MSALTRFSSERAAGATQDRFTIDLGPGRQADLTVFLEADGTPFQFDLLTWGACVEDVERVCSERYGRLIKLTHIDGGHTSYQGVVEVQPIAP